ncbi:hypothetical protein SCLCIDRAFT_115769 [Scleroderma citrinum Foug A]|uniref:Uncharacterized protein n=1 Tax=Scleroderma citrinum Foug A TaxID=1036808 RepID=A0A0C3E6Q8_9AGAM|nr:hypothetical protein SCLCIDRAFT_115769 [Scleroderma citrinum Foug A]
MASVPELLEVKQHAQDLLTIFSETCTVGFCHVDSKVEVLKGQWCTVCKEDEAYIKKYGKWKTFHMGSNSLCCQHIHHHYVLYQECCTEQSLKEHHHAVP